jgi:hypothetical protein
MPGYATELEEWAKSPTSFLPVEHYLCNLRSFADKELATRPKGTHAMRDECLFIERLRVSSIQYGYLRKASQSLTKNSYDFGVAQTYFRLTMNKPIRMPTKPVPTIVHS